MKVVKLNKEDAYELLIEAAAFVKENPEFRDIIIICNDPAMTRPDSMQVFCTNMNTVKLAGMCAMAPQQFYFDAHADQQ